jgi:hydrogenase expression/formation protein HypD
LEGAGAALPRWTGRRPIRFVDEFRDARRARAVARSLAVEADPARRYYLMEFCGGHTHAIARYGVEGLLPASVKMVHGPG